VATQTSSHTSVQACVRWSRQLRPNYIEPYVVARLILIWWLNRTYSRFLSSCILDGAFVYLVQQEFLLDWAASFWQDRSPWRFIYARRIGAASVANTCTTMSSFWFSNRQFRSNQPFVRPCAIVLFEMWVSLLRMLTLVLRFILDNKSIHLADSFDPYLPVPSLVPGVGLTLNNTHPTFNFRKKYTLVFSLN
jgi:hypothetical protein